MFFRDMELALDVLGQVDRLRPALQSGLINRSGRVNHRLDHRLVRLGKAGAGIRHVRIRNTGVAPVRLEGVALYGRMPNDELSALQLEPRAVEGTPVQSTGPLVVSPGDFRLWSLIAEPPTAATFVHLTMLPESIRADSRLLVETSSDGVIDGTTRPTWEVSYDAGSFERSIGPYLDDALALIAVLASDLRSAVPTLRTELPGSVRSAIRSFETATEPSESCTIAAVDALSTVLTAFITSHVCGDPGGRFEFALPPGTRALDVILDEGVVGGWKTGHLTCSFVPASARKLPTTWAVAPSGALPAPYDSCWFDGPAPLHRPHRRITWPSAPPASVVLESSKQTWPLPQMQVRVLALTEDRGWVDLNPVKTALDILALLGSVSTEVRMAEGRNRAAFACGWRSFALNDFRAFKAGLSGSAFETDSADDHRDAAAILNGALPAALQRGIGRHGFNRPVHARDLGSVLQQMLQACSALEGLGHQVVLSHGTLRGCIESETFRPEDETVSFAFAVDAPDRETVLRRRDQAVETLTKRPAQGRDARLYARITLPGWRDPIPFELYPVWRDPSGKLQGALVGGHPHTFGTDWLGNRTERRFYGRPFQVPSEPEIALRELFPGTDDPRPTRHRRGMSADETAAATDALVPVADGPSGLVTWDELMERLVTAISPAAIAWLSPNVPPHVLRWAPSVAVVTHGPATSPAPSVTWITSALGPLEPETVAALRPVLSHAGDGSSIAWIDGHHGLASVLSQVGSLLAIDPDILLAFHDVVPPDIRMAGPRPEEGVEGWVGEVWMLFAWLRRQNTSALVEVYETATTGLGLLRGFDAAAFQALQPWAIRRELAHLTTLPAILAALAPRPGGSLFSDLSDRLGLVGRIGCEFRFVTLNEIRHDPSVEVEVLAAGRSIVRPAADMIVDLSGRDSRVSFREPSTIRAAAPVLLKIPDAVVRGTILIEMSEGRLLLPRVARSDATRGFVEQIFRDGRSDNPGTHFFSGLGRSPNGQIDVAQTDTRELAGDVLWVTPDEWQNWGIWVLQTIPALVHAERSGFDGTVLCYAAHPWQRDLIEAVAPRLSRRLVPQALAFGYRISGRLWTVARELRNMVVGTFEREVFAELADRARRACAQPDHRRIFVSRLSHSRKHPTYRSLVNEAELIDELRRLGFHIVEPETLDVMSQIAMFAGAREIAGLGGAGMFSTVFAESGASILDMESSTTWVEGHANLFATSGARYGVIFGTPVEDAGPHSRWTLPIPDTVDLVRRFFEIAD